MTRIYRWSMMVYSSLQAEFMVPSTIIFISIQSIYRWFLFAALTKGDQSIKVNFRH